jgi:ribosome-associated protein
VRAVAEHVMMEMKKAGLPVHHAEGLEQGRWALLDYVDFVVHVFHPTLRQFYQLERLWGDAREVPLGDGAPAASAAGAGAAAARGGSGVA